MTIELGNNVSANDLRPAAETVARYLHDNNFDTIILNGTSAKSGFYLVEAAWERLFSKQKIPRVVSVGMISKQHFGELTLVKARQTSNIGSVELAHKLENILKTRPATKIVIFDEAVIHGEELSRMRSLLVEMGYSGIKTCALYRNINKELKTKIDFVASAGTADFPEIYAQRRKLFDIIMRNRFDAQRAKKGSKERQQFKQASDAARAKLKSLIRNLRK